MDLPYESNSKLRTKRFWVAYRVPETQTCLTTMPKCNKTSSWAVLTNVFSFSESIIINRKPSELTLSSSSA